MSYATEQFAKLSPAQTRQRQRAARMSARHRSGFARAEGRRAKRAIGRHKGALTAGAVMVAGLGAGAGAYRGFGR